MPLERKTISIPLSTGVNQKADLRSLTSTGAAVMTNCVVTKDGAIRKRFGQVALSPLVINSSTISSAVAGGSYKTTPWLSDGEKFYAYSDANGIWSFQDILPDAVALDRIGVNGWTQSFLDYDLAAANGLVLMVMTADPQGLGFDTLWYTVFDPLTKATVIPVSLVDSSIASQINGPKLVVCGTTAVLTYVQSGNIIGRKLDMTGIGAGWSTAVTIANDGFNNVTFGVYDTCATAGDATRFAVAYEINTANKVKIATINVSNLTVNTSQTDDTTFSNVTAIACVSTNAEWHWATYFAASGGVGNASIRGWAWQDSSPSTHVAPFTVASTATSTPGRVVACRFDSTHVNVIWSPGLNVAASDGTNMAAATTRAVTMTTSGTAGRIRPVAPVVVSTKPYVASNGQCYVGVQTPSKSQGTAYLARDDGFGEMAFTPQQPLRPVATLDPRLAKYTTILIPAGNSGQSAPHLLPLPTVGANSLGLGVVENTLPSRATLYVHVCDVGSPLRYSAAELGTLEAIGCGTPMVYDGQTLSDLGYTAYPQIASATFSGVGGSMQTSGTYNYIAIYEWLDARGNIHRSATSTISVAATGAGNTGSCSVVVPGNSFGYRFVTAGGPSTKSDPTTVLYRTQANGTTFYRVSTIPSGLDATSNQTIVDTASDTSIASNELVYTTGGILDNYCPPTARCCILHRNRWWLAGCASPTDIWPSKELTPGEAPGFNEAMNFSATGSVRALQSMDDKLVIFVQRGSTYGIEVVTGEGPTDAGTQSDWTPPQPVPTDAGAVDQRSTCAGPFGVVFRSTTGGPTGQGGVFLLSRDLQVRYISGPVEDTFAANPIVTSMVLHPTQGRVYVTCTPTDTGFSSGTRLVWDYDQGGVWSIDAVWDTNLGIFNGARCAFTAGTGSRIAYHWATPQGIVYRETNGIGSQAYTDAGTWVTMTYTSALLTPNEGGFTRFWRAFLEGDSLEVANLSIVCTFDGAPSSYYSEPSSWTAANVTAFDRYPQVDVEHIVGNQKAKSIQVSISDAQPLSFTTGQGFSFARIVLEMGIKEGAYRNIPAAQRG